MKEERLRFLNANSVLNLYKLLKEGVRIFV